VKGQIMAEPILRFPLRGPDPLEPAPELARLRTECPAARIELPSGHQAWLVTRYADARAALADPRLSKAATTVEGAPRILPVAANSKSIFSMDPPEHTRVRRLVTPAFGARRIAAMRKGVEELTDSLLDELEATGQPGDLVAGLALPLPIRVICELLGVPYEDTEKFRDWTDVMLSITAHAPADVLAARRNLNAYLSELIVARREQPADDLLTVLIRAAEDDDRLSHEELLAFGHTLLVAGYHATAGELIHALLHLMSRPDQLAVLRDDPALIEPAVEELLRFSTAGSGASALRVATEDVEIAGVKVRAGEAVLASAQSANRDEEVFACPEQLDVTRQHNPHLAFGHGVHHCIGAQLGRMELAVAITRLLARFPDVHLDPHAELRWIGGMAFSRPAALPVRW
jgi:cytochrome P450